MSQSATLVPVGSVTPSSPRWASRRAREVEFAGGVMTGPAASSAGSTRGRSASGSSARTARTQGRARTVRCSMPRTGSPRVIQARSRSLAARASKQPLLEATVWNSRLTRGQRLRKPTTASAMKCRTVVAPVVIRTVPASPRACSRSRRTARSMPPMPSAAAACRTRPAWVGTTPRACRSRRLTPNSFSRRLTCWLTADCVQVRSRATALRLPRGTRPRRHGDRPGSQGVKLPFRVRVKPFLGELQGNPRIDLDFARTPRSLSTRAATRDGRRPGGFGGRRTTGPRRAGHDCAGRDRTGRSVREGPGPSGNGKGDAWKRSKWRPSDSPVSRPAG